MNFYLIYFLFLLLLFDYSLLSSSFATSSFSSLSSSLSSQNLIQNGNAETGQLYPWKSLTKGWKITHKSFVSGNYSFVINSYDISHHEEEAEHCSSSHYEMYQYLILSSSDTIYSLSFWARSLFIREKNPILSFSIDFVETNFFSFPFHVDASSTLYHFYSTNFTLPQDHINLVLSVSTCFPIEIDDISIFPILSSSSSSPSSSSPSSSSPSITLTPPLASSPFYSNYKPSPSSVDKLVGHQTPLNDSFQQ
jgi:hypothetical protein